MLPATVRRVLCQWCEQRPATLGGGCVDCFVTIAGQAFELLDALADLTDVGAEHELVIALERRAGRWRAILGRPAPTGTRAEADDLLTAILQLADAIRAGGVPA